VTKRRKPARPTFPTFTFAYIHPGTVSASFAFSFARMMAFQIGQFGQGPKVLAQRVGSGQIVRGRNDVVANFLNDDTEWLVFCDADMGFAHDAVAGLLMSADRIERPVVGGLAFALKKGGETDWDTQAERYRHCPTVYRWVENDNEAGFQVVTDYPRDTVVKIAASGAAFFCVHRSVLEKIRDEYGPDWFTPVQHPKRSDPFGEDFSFFVRVAGVDVPAYVNTAVKTSHDKGGIFLTEETWDLQQQLAELRGELDQPAA
jgi:hypothetical protein